MTTPRPRQAQPHSGRRPRRGSLQPRSEPFLRRHRTRLLWAGAIAVFGVLAFMAYLNATSPAYGCSIIFDPTPAPTAAAASPAGTPAPDASPAPPVNAYVQPDMGHDHVTPGSFVKYLYCPPASGRHYSETVSGQGPIRIDVYGPEEQTRPQGWIHNLEHGGVVVLYRCPGPGCDESAMADHEALFQAWPASRVCNFPPHQLSPVITRFDDMPWPYAVVAWDVVMPLEAFDAQAILNFQATYEERFNPEPVCAAPTPTPGPTATPAPSATPASSASPAQSPAETAASPAPVESPGESPVASPS